MFVLKFKTQIINQYCHLICCVALLWVVGIGCARTAPMDDDTATSESSAIRPYSSDVNSSTDNSVPFEDTQTHSSVDSNDTADSNSGTSPDSNSSLDSGSADTASDSADLPDTLDTIDTATGTGEDSAPAEDSETLTDDTETASDSDSGPPPCECNEHQWCEESTGKCWCNSGYTGKDCLACDPDDGYVPWPAEEGVCIPEICSDIACAGDAICRVDEHGRPECGCPAGLTGTLCKQQWNTLLVPPFASDVAFDSDGNGWFATDQGLLYWRFNNTPEDTSDDETQWYVSRNFTAVNTIDIDSYGRKWIGVNKRLVVLNDGGTPMNREDDSELTLAADFGTFVDIAEIVLDSNDRCWLITDTGSEIYVLENINTLVPPDFVSGTLVTPDWQTPVSEEGIMDLAVEGNGIWMGGAGGLAYWDFAAGIDDSGDDVTVRFENVALPGDASVSHVAVDSEGQKWITAASGILHLNDRGQIFESSRHLWTSWSLPGDGSTERIGPLVATGPDGAKWLASTWGALVRINDSNAATVTRTEYAPRSTAEWADISIRRDVTAISMDSTGKKWLIHSGMLYVLDDNGTPMNAEDDVWTRVPKRFIPSVDSLSETVPDAHGGAWVRGTWNSQGAPGCTDELLYVSPGDFTDGFDDVAVQYRDYVFGNEYAFCGTIHGIDANGLVWFGDSAYKWTEEITFVLNDNGTPLNPDDDIMAEYNDDEEAAFIHSVLGFDPVSGAWVDSGYFSPGESLSNPDDDLFAPVAPTETVTSLKSVAVDTAGYKWFGYNTVYIPDEGWVSSGLQCLDDGGTLQDTADDSWVSFLAEDGLPFRAITEVQIGGNGLIWLRKNVDEKKSPQFGALDNRETPMDNSDDIWVVVYMGYYLYNGNAVLCTIHDFDANGNADVWFGTNYGVQYLHLNN